jgi:hypothetical protein
MSSNYEEYFASDNDSVGSNESVEIPMKRIVTLVPNHETVSKNLKAQNLNQVKDMVKKAEAEQVRYLSLDNASKDLEILELKEKIKNLEKIVNLMNKYEAVFSILEKNTNTYVSLYKKVNNVNYRDMMREEGSNIQQHSLPDSADVNLPKMISAIHSIYNSFKMTEESKRNIFHDCLFWNATASKRNIYFVCEFIIGLVLFILILKGYSR